MKDRSKGKPLRKRPSGDVRMHSIITKDDKSAIVDITELKKKEDSLQLEPNKLKIILDTMQDGVYIVSRQHEIEYINSAVEKEFGPVKGLKCHEYFNNLPEACTWCNDRDVYAQKTVRWDWNSPKTGKTYDIVDTMVRNGDGSFSKLGIFRDTTDRKKMEELLRNSEFQLRSLSAQLLTAEEEERGRISRELHDSLGQSLAVIELQVSHIRNNLPRGQEILRDECEKTLLSIREAIEETRHLSRDLSPSILEDLGLTTALKRLVKDASDYHGVEAILNIEPIDPYLPRKDQIILYRIVQEAFTNVGKHAQASKVSISVRMQEKNISFDMEDNGRGFDVDQIGKVGPIIRGLGLATMKERVRMLGGILDLRSQVGSGTRISFTIPLPKGGDH